MNLEELNERLIQALKELKAARTAWDAAREATNGRASEYRKIVGGGPYDPREDAEYMRLRAAEEPLYESMRGAEKRVREVDTQIARHPDTLRAEKIAREQRAKADKLLSPDSGFGINEYGSGYVAWAKKYEE